MAFYSKIALLILVYSLLGCGVEPTVSSIPEDWIEGSTEDTSEPEDPSSVPNGDDAPIIPDDDSNGDTAGGDEPDSETPDDGTPDTGLTPCDIAWGLFSQCEPPPEGCENSAVGECILEIGPAVGGYCEVMDGEQCNGGQLDDAAYEYCQIQSCLGDDYDACVAQLASTCVSESCVELDDVVGHCPGYDYACESASPTESQCLLDVFESMSQPCGLFADAPQCALGVVTETGWGSCQVQDCLNLTTFEACYSNLEVLCSFSAP